MRYCTETSGKYVVVEDPICLLYIDVFEELRRKVDTNDIRMSGDNISKVILDKVKALIFQWRVSLRKAMVVQLL